MSAPLPYQCWYLWIALLICGAFVPVAPGPVRAAPTIGEHASASAGQFTPLCDVTYTVTSQWHDGFNAQVTITNHDARIAGWELAWTFAGNQTITAMWNAEPVQNGPDVRAADAGHNAVIEQGASVSFGFQAAYSGSNTDPTSFWLNGNQCNLPAPATPVPSPTVSGFACTVDYVVRSEWYNGFVADLTIVNHGPEITGWRLDWTFPGDQQITSAWNAVVTQNGADVTMDDAGHNATIPGGGRVGLGFQATYSGVNGVPAEFFLNDVRCQITGLATPTPTPAPTATPEPCPPVVIDGDFNDWDCPPFVDDPAFDCSIERLDLLRFAFTTNPDEPTAYFMAERNGDSGILHLKLLVDTNDNGIYDEPIDRIMRVRYQARPRDSRVTVTLLDGTGVFLETIADRADWGASKAEGGRHVEWSVSLDQLGILAGQALRVILESHPSEGNSPACDTTDEVQWSPADALGGVLLLLLLLGGSVWMARRRRRQGAACCAHTGEENE